MDGLAKNVFIESLFDDTGMFGFGEEGFVSKGDGGDGIVDLRSPCTSDVRDVCNSGRMEYSGPPLGTAATESGESWIPAEGVLVSNVIEAFIKYSEYGRRTGFEVRFRSSELSAKGKAALGDQQRRMKVKRGLSQNWYFGDHENCSRVRMQCVKGEKCRPNRRNPDRAILTQATGCMAGVTLINNYDGTWVFKKVRVDHNHDCDPSSTRFMKNYRLISGSDERQIVVDDRAGVNTSRTFMTFVVSNGGIDRVPFSAKDCHSVIRRWRLNSMDNGDFNSMQKFFNEMRSVSEDFFYLYDTDEDGRLRNVFWADGRSRAAFRDFGDVVSFDTTHLKNRYKMPLAPFIGVNHHGQSILLGCALVTKEDTESFIWVFDSWMKCMRRQHPKYIMTDQCQAIGKAIAFAFPNSRHRWCLWHVMRNGEKHLKGLKEWRNIRSALKEAVHDACSPSDFEGMWNKMLTKFCLGANKWLKKMYEVRERWVPAYFLHEFWAGLHSTQRSEGMNNFFRGYVNMNTGLRQFAEQYCVAAGKRVDDEERENWRSINRPALCETRFTAEIELQKFYTVKKFIEFQVEAKGVVYTKAEFLICEKGKSTYNVIDKGVQKVFGEVVTRSYIVEYNTENNDTICECKKFSFRGIICRHMIAVWQDVDLKILPQKYIVDRWRKDIIRECSYVKVPNVTLPFDSSEDYNKIEQLDGVMRDILKMAVARDDLFCKVIAGLNSIRKECLQCLGNGDDVCIDSVGRLYYKHVDTPAQKGSSNFGHEDVLDPVDRRGKGRVRKHRTGYLNSNSKRSRNELEGAKVAADVQVVGGISSENANETMGYNVIETLQLDGTPSNRGCAPVYWI